MLQRNASHQSLGAFININGLPIAVFLQFGMLFDHIVSYIKGLVSYQEKCVVRRVSPNKYIHMYIY